MFCSGLNEMQPVKITVSFFLPVFPMGILAAWQNSNWEQMLQGQVLAAAELHAGSARELLGHQKELKLYAARLVFTPFIPQILPRGHLFQIFAQNRNFSSVQKSRRARNFLRVKVWVFS